MRIENRTIFQIVTLVVILIAGGLVRFLQLSTNYIESDEIGYTILSESIARGSWFPTSPLGIGGEDPYVRVPSLFFYLGAFVINALGSSLLSTRIISFFFGIATIFLVYKWARLYVDKGYSLFAAGMYAVYPLTVYYSSIAVLDALYTFFATTTLYLYQKFVNRPSVLAAFAVGLFLGIACGAKQFGFLLVVLLAMHLWFNLPRREKLSSLLKGLIMFGIVLIFANLTLFFAKENVLKWASDYVTSSILGTPGHPNSLDYYMVQIDRVLRITEVAAILLILLVVVSLFFAMFLLRTSFFARNTSRRLEYGWDHCLALFGTAVVVFVVTTPVILIDPISAFRQLVVLEIVFKVRDVVLSSAPVSFAEPSFSIPYQPVNLILLIAGMVGLFYFIVKQRLSLTDHIFALYFLMFLPALKRTSFYMQQDHYGVSVTPMVAVFLVYLISQVENDYFRGNRVFGLCLRLATFVMILAMGISLLSPLTRRPPIQDAFEWVKQNSEPGSLVLSNIDRVVVDFYTQRRTLPDWEDSEKLHLGQPELADFIIVDRSSAAKAASMEKREEAIHNIQAKYSPASVFHYPNGEQVLVFDIRKAKQKTSDGS